MEKCPIEGSREGCFRWGGAQESNVLVVHHLVMHRLFGLVLFPWIWENGPNFQAVPKWKKKREVSPPLYPPVVESVRNGQEFVR